MKSFILFIGIAIAIVACNNSTLDSEVDPSCSTNCSLVPESGDCKALFKRYYFDPAEGKCKEFVWGGCGGVVPFETLEECESCKCDNGQSGD
jgi:Kunitz/Bovine pancreatic trypsin inhibitor domain